MIVNHKFKFIFIKTVKTAGTSIELFLSRYCDELDIVTPILPPEEGHLPRNYQGIFNPVPELVSGASKKWKNTARDLINRKKFYNHIPACLVKSRISTRIWNNYYKFCVERNPWDKTISEYHMLKHKHDKNLTFEQYLTNTNFCLNFHRYTDPWNRNQIIVDHVIKYEKLSQELSEVFEKLGIPFEGHLNTYAKASYRRKKSPYQAYFNSNQRQLVQNIFQHEILMHGYTFNG